ncbi:hypothetical protein JYT71_00450, partial [Acidimicrobiaceae bacterium AH-315-P05]|nr:hypothetical protein [Acidimicrobiaceae bacterium AH-315-P05]
LLIASAGIGIDDDGTEYLCTPYTGVYRGEPGICRWYLVEGLDTPSALRDFPWSMEHGRGLWSDVAIAGEFTGTLQDGVVTDPRFIGPPQADQTYEIGCNTNEAPLAKHAPGNSALIV